MRLFSRKRVPLSLKKGWLFDIIEGRFQLWKTKFKLNRPRRSSDKKFTRDVKGYFPDEVDGYLDDIMIQDYEILPRKNTAEYEAKIADFASSQARFFSKGRRLMPTPLGEKQAAEDFRLQPEQSEKAK
jgi:hypothetical protein